MLSLFYRYSIIIFLFILSACDSDRFLGHKYEAQQLLKAAPVEGIVSNIFTQKPVSKAQVSINNQVTFTNDSGFYSINVFVNTDAQRNKPVPVRITASNYYAFSDSFIIYPAANLFNASLVYGAPIIEAALHKEDTVQAIILDYQGISTLDSVSAIFTYWIEGVSATEVTFSLELKKIEGMRGFYEFYVEPDREDVGNLRKEFFFIYARDKDGFQIRKSFRSFDAQDFLF